MNTHGMHRPTEKNAECRWLGPPPLPFGHPDFVGAGLRPKPAPFPGQPSRSLGHARTITTARAIHPQNNAQRDGKYSCRHPESVIVVD